MIFYHFYTFFLVLIGKKIPVYWYKDRANFGDAINVFLITKISGKDVLWINPKYWPLKHYLVIGSILEISNNKSLIWGSGFISEKSYVSKPGKILAVRGPSTRGKYIGEGVDCPEVYGDPALLLPMIYKPEIKRKYKMGVVPHYVDKDSAALSKVLNCESWCVIDIERDNPTDFIDDLLACDVVLSSSLHGLIVADAYGIPSIWVKFSDKVKGGDFKFYDYFESVGKRDQKPIHLTESSDFSVILSNVSGFRIQIDLIKLMNSCPFGVL